MGHGIIDTLDQFLDALNSSSQYGSNEWQTRLSTIRRTLQERRTAIESSSDPFIEGLSTILTVARTPGDITHNRSHVTPPCNDSTSSVGVAGAQIQALSRQSSVTSQYPVNSSVYCDLAYSPMNQPNSRPESICHSESGRSIDERRADEAGSGESSQAEPEYVGPVTPSAANIPFNRSPHDSHEVIVEIDADSQEVESPFSGSGFYRPLSSVKETMTVVNMYVVAVEMIRASVRNLITQRDVLNYRAIDPSVHGTPAGAGVDFSVQILAPNDAKQFHINFGDIIRLKRVNAQLVVDKSGNRHINIIMSLKNHPSMRVWPNESCYSRQDAMSDNNSPTGNDHASQDEATSELSRLESEAQVIYGGNKTGVEPEDLTIISRLRKWVREKLDAVDLTTNRNFLNSIAGAGPYASDFIVCILEVAPEPEVNLVVSDASSVAVVMGLNDILISNLIESNNSVKPGEWLKLRYMQRAPNCFQRADGSNAVVLKACNFSCVTRLPQCDLPHMKPIATSSSRSKRARRATRMKMWNSASGLNKSFPRHLFGSTGFVDRLLQYNCDEEGEFEKVPKSVDEEAEEGEIRAIPQH
ncbi:hypothetical protein X943_001885 [Babesia divergens]|uniref:Telomeric single stranded DNA binding POT1/Cdc13 domain-containing protein n=1 Tax=Babesia divergens TaxID=32595 RepID=A0AAD9GJU6_BABDI|nr:hypothetical protein X943_001885 [Babesia divergens]